MLDWTRCEGYSGTKLRELIHLIIILKKLGDGCCSAVDNSLLSERVFFVINLFKSDFYCHLIYKSAIGIEENSNSILAVNICSIYVLDFDFILDNLTIPTILPSTHVLPCMNDSV